MLTYVTFHGICMVSPRDSFVVGVSVHLWATLCVTCSGSQGDLMPPVSRGRGTRPLGVSCHAVCAVISVSPDVKV